MHLIILRLSKLSDIALYTLIAYAVLLTQCMHMLFHQRLGITLWTMKCKKEKKRIKFIILASYE